MKNARKYERAARKLLSVRGRTPRRPAEADDPVAGLVRAVLEADGAHKRADKAMDALRKEYVDLNELRVAPPREVAELLGKDYPLGRRKAEEIATALNNLFRRANALSFDHAKPMTKRDLRRHLGELGLGPYAAAWLMLYVFGGHAIPLDETLLECLQMDHYVHPEADLADVQGFLERLVLQKDAPAAHEALRDYVDKSARALARKRKAEAVARDKAEAAARAKAEAAARKAEAAARAKAEAAARRAAKAAKAKAAKAKAAKAKAAKTKAAKAKAARKRRPPAKAKRPVRAKRPAKPKPAGKAARPKRPAGAKGPPNRSARRGRPKPPRRPKPPPKAGKPRPRPKPRPPRPSRTAKPPPGKPQQGA